MWVLSSWGRGDIPRRCFHNSNSGQECCTALLSALHWESRPTDVNRGCSIDNQSKTHLLVLALSFGPTKGCHKALTALWMIGYTLLISHGPLLALLRLNGLCCLVLWSSWVLLSERYGFLLNHKIMLSRMLICILKLLSNITAFHGLFCTSNLISGRFYLIGWLLPLQFCLPSLDPYFPFAITKVCILLLYLDDILILTHSKHAGKRTWPLHCSLVVCLGLHINFSKSGIHLCSDFPFWTCVVIQVACLSLCLLTNLIIFSDLLMLCYSSNLL